MSGGVTPRAALVVGAVALGVASFALGLVVAGGERAPFGAVKSVDSPALDRLAAAVDELREVVAAQRAPRDEMLAPPEPRRPVPGPSERDDGDLVASIEALREEIVAQRLRGHGGAGPRQSGIARADAIASRRRPAEPDVVATFLADHPRISDGQIPLTQSFWGVEDYIEAFGWPDDYTVLNDPEGRYQLTYFLDPALGSDGPELELQCTRTVTVWMAAP